MSSTLVLVCGLLVAAPPLLFGHLGQTHDEASALECLISGYCLAAVPYLVVLFGWRRLDAGPRGLWALLVVAFIARAVLLTLPPLLSEDIWRYIWDGVVQSAGINPYLYAPVDPALDSIAAADPLRTAIRAQIGHAAIPTIYPPVAQVTFLGVALISPSATLMRVVMIGADVLVVAAVWRWLLARDGDPRAAALYAFAPLSVLESAVGGHVEPLAVALLCLAIQAVIRKQRTFAGVTLGSAIAAKLLPALLVPFLLPRHRVAAVLACLIAILWYLPYLGAGTRLVSGLGAFTHRWRGNAGGFDVVAWPFERIAAGLPAPIEGLPSWAVDAVTVFAGHGSPGVWPDELALACAKAGVALLLTLIWVVALLGKKTIEGYVVPPLGALLLLAPVVHPWYLLWLLPFCAVAMGRRGPAAALWPVPFLLWSLLCWIPYLPRPEYIRTGLWVESPMWRFMEYAPVWLGLAVVAISAKVVGRGHVAQSSVVSAGSHGAGSDNRDCSDAPGHT